MTAQSISHLSAAAAVVATAGGANTTWSQSLTEIRCEMDSLLAALSERCRPEECGDITQDQLAAAIVLCYCGIIIQLIDEAIPAAVKVEETGSCDCLSVGLGKRSVSAAVICDALTAVTPILTAAVADLLKQADLTLNHQLRMRANSDFIGMLVVAEIFDKNVQIARRAMMAEGEGGVADGIVLEMLATAGSEISLLGNGDERALQLCAATPRTATVAQIVLDYLDTENVDTLLALMHALRIVKPTLENFGNVCAGLAGKLADTH